MYVRAGVVEVFAFEIDLTVAEFAGEPVAVIDRSGSALELAADAAEFVDKMRGLTDGLISLIDFFKGFFKFWSQVRSAVGTEMSGGRGVVAEIT